MSSTSKKIPAVPIVKPRLITVGRGKAPRVQTESRPGPSHHVGAVPSHQGAGAGPSVPTVVREAAGNEESQLGLRKPKLVRQEPNVIKDHSNNLMEENHHKSGLPNGLTGQMTEWSSPDFSLMKNNNKMATTDKKEIKEYEKMKEEFREFKEESGASLEFLKNQVYKLQKDHDKDLEIQRLNNELIIQQKLLDIQANVAAKKGNVLTEVSPEVSPPPPPPPPPPAPAVSRFQFPPPDLAVPPPFRRFSVPQPASPSPLDYRQYWPPPVPVFLPPASQSPLARPLSSAGSLGQPSRGEEMETGSAVSYYSFDRRSGGEDDQGLDVDGVVYNMSFIQQQEEIFKQLEDKKRETKLEETRSLELIQQLSIEEDLNRATSSDSSIRTNRLTSHWESLDPSPPVRNDSWTKVAARNVGRPAGPRQGKARKEQKEVEARERERKWEEWRREMREREERERENIVKSHLDRQKLKMIKEGSVSQSPAVTSATSVAPVQALTLGEIVPTGRRHQATPGQKINPRSRRQTEVSEFEAERKRAAFELKRRIEAQEEERRRKTEKERLEREWELARVRSDHQENIGTKGGKGGNAGKKRVN